MSRAVDDLLAVLDLEQLEHNLFRARSPQVGWQRVFGGQVIGQALVAACRTLDVRTFHPHSLHAYFLLGGDPKVPIIYDVDRLRDGRSFVTRRVIAIQHGRPIFAMSVSFHIDEPASATVPPGVFWTQDTAMRPPLLGRVRRTIRAWSEPGCGGHSSPAARAG